MGKRTIVHQCVLERLEDRQLLSGGTSGLATHEPVMHFRHIGQVHTSGHVWTYFGRGQGSGVHLHGRRHRGMTMVPSSAGSDASTSAAASTTGTASPNTAAPTNGTTSVNTAASSLPTSEPFPTQPAGPTVNYIKTVPLMMPPQSTLLPSSQPVNPPQSGGAAAGVMPTAPVGTDQSTLAPPPHVIPSFLGPAILSKADVALLKSTADTFAGSYTSGADAAQDKAAVAALQSGLEDLSIQYWSETHVVDKDSVTTLQQAVDSFAASYTSGANLAQDTAAWQSLRAALSSFWTSIQSTGSSTGPLTLPAQPVMMPFGPFPVSSDGILAGLPSLLSSGQVTLSKDNTSKLQQAVDTFAGAYTSGADPAKDQAAETSLETSLNEIVQSLWPVPTVWPLMMRGDPVPAPPVPSQGTAAASGSATS
jgi:hypothetical protein